MKGGLIPPTLGGVYPPVIEDVKRAFSMKCGRIPPTLGGVHPPVIEDVKHAIFYERCEDTTNTWWCPPTCYKRCKTCASSMKGGRTPPTLGGVHPPVIEDVKQ